MSKNGCIISAVIVLLCVNASAFTVPETLKYEVSIGGIPIGIMILEAKDMGSSIRLESTMSTASWASIFYGASDRAVSSLKKIEPKGPQKNFPYRAQTYQIRLHEGPHKVDAASVFDHHKNLVFCSDFLNNQKTFLHFKEGTLDLLSVLYFLRAIPLTPGKSVFVDIYHNKMIRHIEVRVIGKEKIQIPSGSFNTITVMADTYFEGFGVINYPGDVVLWFTDDERRIPLVVEKKLPLLMEGKLPGFVTEKMPMYLKEKLSTGSIRATLIQ